MNCNICNKEFDTFKELTKHLIDDHKYGIHDIYKYYEYSFESRRATCPICGTSFKITPKQAWKYKSNPRAFIGCHKECSIQLRAWVCGSPFAKKEVREKSKQTMLERYGVEHSLQSAQVREKVKKTNLERYGVENVTQSPIIQEKTKKTNLEKYGVEYAAQSKEVQEKMEKTMMERYGVKHPAQSKEFLEKMQETTMERYGVKNASSSPEIKEKRKQTFLERYGVDSVCRIEELKEKNHEKMKETNLKKYGVEYPVQHSEFFEKMKKTTFERYGTEYICQHELCLKKSKRISNVNKKFQKFLSSNNISSELEFVIEKVGYDLKVGDFLIEIDPYYTHNITKGPYFGGSKRKEPISEDYHAEKTKFAKEHGYNCIHIFDWDDPNKIVNLLQPKERIYARECEVKEIDKKVAKEFLESYHLQGSTRGVKFACGLFYKGELVEVMTFGKPRYNKNYEYELLRLCTKPTVSVIGGASKILNFFEEQVKPSSLISYCDLSKFNGEVYAKLGFELKEQTAPTKHWYHPKTKKHITDNLLRQRGFDQLHKTNFGKGTSNEELMKEYGYVEIYDCGQLVFVKEFKNY